MKTIELSISGQKAQFTTKSVTFDGKEYLYSHMTNLDHSPVVRTYRFEYDDGDTKLLTYEKKDAKLLTAIFSQVHKMIEAKKAKAAEKPSEAPVEKEPKEPAAEASAETVEEKTETPAEAGETSDVMDEMVKATIALNEERAKKEAEKAAKKARKKAIKEAKKNGTPLPEDVKKEDDIANATEDATPVDPEKQARIKKSFKIFGIIIVAVIAAALIYYFVFGTSNAPTETNPGVTESQQYEDIDQLIDDLQ